MNRIGIDLGGTKIEGVLLDENGRVLRRRRRPTNRREGYQAIVSRLAGLVGELSAAATAETRIGICTPGAISPHTGNLKNSNTTCLIGKPLRQDLEKLLGQAVILENDANCFAMAEATLGAARDYGVVFGVILGTGVGGGIVFNRQLHRGRTHIAGEWGHHTLYPHGKRCYCGHTGCVETYISGPALERRWTELSGETLPLARIARRTDHSCYPDWKQEFLEHLGLALANVIDILDPDAIVLGGGVSNVGFLYDEGAAAVHDRVFSDIVDTPILRNELGDSAGVFGAAYLEPGT